MHQYRCGSDGGGIQENNFCEIFFSKIGIRVDDPYTRCPFFILIIYHFFYNGKGSECQIARSICSRKRYTIAAKISGKGTTPVTHIPVLAGPPAIQSLAEICNPSD